MRSICLTGSVLFCALGIAAPQAADAAIIAADDFETYSTGGLTGQNGGTGWSAGYTGNATAGVVSGGLVYDNGLFIDGGSQAVSLLNPGTTIPVVRKFAPQTGTLYFSLLFSPISGMSPNGSDFLQFILDDNGNQFNAMTFGVRNSTEDGFYARIQGNNSGAGSGDDTKKANVEAVNGVTYLLVGAMSKTNASANYNRVDFYLNPTTTDESILGALSYTNANFNSGVTTLSNFTIRTADALGQFNFDAVRIGTTWADVTGPLNMTAVPEPSSLLLVGAVTAGAAWRRRRNRVRPPVTAA